MVFLQIWYKIWLLVTTGSVKWHLDIPLCPTTISTWEGYIWKRHPCSKQSSNGWRESPAYLCAALETIKDISNDMSRKNIGRLPEHSLKEHTKVILGIDLPPKPPMLKLYQLIIDVYIKDFIILAQNPLRSFLKTIARAIIISIHYYFCLPIHQVKPVGTQ